MAKKKTARKSKTKRSTAKSSKTKSAKRPEKSAAKKRGSKKTPAAKSRGPAAKKKPAPKKAPAAAKPAASRMKPAPVSPRPPSAPAARTPTPAAPVAGPREEAIGRVTHYFSHLTVAVVELDKGSLALGDKIHFKGHTTDFGQNVESIEIEHQSVMRAEKGQTFGLKVHDQVREHDVVYKVLS